MVTTTDSVRNAMTVDVEDYFHADAVEAVAPQAAWAQMPCRIERNVDVVLALLHQHQVRATFFTLGWIARRYPAMVRAIGAAGHDYGVIGYRAPGCSVRPEHRWALDTLYHAGYRYSSSSYPLLRRDGPRYCPAGPIPFSEASCGRAGKASSVAKRPSNPCGADHDSVS